MIWGIGDARSSPAMYDYVYEFDGCGSPSCMPAIKPDDGWQTAHGGVPLIQQCRQSCD